jgi:hypothetical protein
MLAHGFDKAPAPVARAESGGKAWRKPARLGNCFDDATADSLLDRIADMAGQLVPVDA